MSRKKFHPRFINQDIYQTRIELKQYKQTLFVFALILNSHNSQTPGQHFLESPVRFNLLQQELLVASRDENIRQTINVIITNTMIIIINVTILINPLGIETRDDSRLHHDEERNGKV